MKPLFIYEALIERHNIDDIEIIVILSHKNKTLLLIRRILSRAKY